MHFKASALRKVTQGGSLVLAALLPDPALTHAACTCAIAVRALEDCAGTNNIRSISHVPLRCAAV